MTAQLFLYNKLTRSICPVPSYDPTAAKRLAIDDAIEREQKLAGMIEDMRKDFKDAVKERIRLQTELWNWEWM